MELPGTPPVPYTFLYQYCMSDIRIGDNSQLKDWPSLETEIQMSHQVVLQGDLPHQIRSRRQRHHWSQTVGHRHQGAPVRGPGSRPQKDRQRHYGRQAGLRDVNVSGVGKQVVSWKHSPPESKSSIEGNRSAILCRFRGRTVRKWSFGLAAVSDIVVDAECGLRKGRDCDDASK